MTLVIDCRGHYTTSPEPHNLWRQQQKAAFKEGQAAPVYPAISDDEIRESLEKNQIRLLKERGADTCVYHQPGITLLADVIENKNILFGSEMVGAVRGIDPTTGHYFDDTKRYIDPLDISAEEKHAIFEGNVRRVFSRLDAMLRKAGQ